jgi:lipopolysaccharide export system permease protein
MIIFRYLTKEVYATLLGTTLILLLIFFTNQFIHYLGRAASGGIPARTVMQLMTLQVPLLLGYMLPLGLFLGILLAYGRLYADNEMTILSACGVSKIQLITMTLAFSALIAILVGILMLWVEPRLAWYRDYIFAEAASASPVETIFPGRFQTIGDSNWVFYVGDISRDHKVLDNIFVTKVPETASDPWSIVSAKGGSEWLDPKTGDQFMVLNNGYRYSGNPGKKDFQIVKYDKYYVRVQTAKFHMKKEAEFLPTAELWRMRHNDLNAAIELQWRFAMPISALILAILAVPLSRVRPRKGRYAKLVPAILFYIIYADLIFVAQALIKKHTLSPLPGLWLVHGLMLILSLFLIAHYLDWFKFYEHTRSVS